MHAVDPSPPAAGDGFEPVQPVDITESVAARLHGTDQPVVCIFLYHVNGQWVPGQPQDLAAEFKPGHPHAGLHHSVHIRIGLFKGGIVPCFPHDLRVIGQVTAPVADDGDLFFDDLMIEVHEGGLPLLIPRYPVILYQSLEK